VDDFCPIYSTEQYLFAVSGQVIVGVWRQQACKEGVEVFSNLCKEMRDRYAHFGLIALAEPGAAMPSSPERRSMASTLRDQAGALVGATFIIEGSGFRAATVRSVAIGLAMLAQQPFPFHIVASADLASSWMVDQLTAVGAPLRSVIALVADVNRLRHAPLSAARTTG